MARTARDGALKHGQLLQRRFVLHLDSNTQFSHQPFKIVFKFVSSSPIFSSSRPPRRTLLLLCERNRERSSGREQAGG